MKPTKTTKTRRVTCKSCGGSGRIDDHESPVRRCDDCMGNGYYRANKPPTKTTGRVMYAVTEAVEQGRAQFTAGIVYPEGDRPYLVLPLTPEAIRARVMRMAKVIYRFTEFRRDYPNSPFDPNYSVEQKCIAQARATVIADGVSAKMVDAALKTK